MSAFKKAYDDNGYIVRLYNSSDREETARLEISPLHMVEKLTFGKFEVKTFRIDTEKKTFVETNLIEWEN